MPHSAYILELCFVIYAQCQSNYISLPSKANPDIYDLKVR